jgi:peptidoglycan hydrolase-like protein with peptidoglycan-binding domain
MNWRIAKALLMLRDEINDKWPGRRKDSDGAIGDANHASRSSDHNPWVTDPPGPNVVTAMDFTHDPNSGCDSYALAQWLLDSRDPRIKYVISNRKIASGSNGPKAWEWRAYSGTNPHNHHCHISVRELKPLYDSVKPWGIMKGEIDSDTIHQPDEPNPTQRLGMRGPLVQQVQVAVGVEADGYFGPITKLAVIEFQKEHGLFGDGIVGPQTWRVLERA